MHKIFHILSTAIHFLWGLSTMLIMHSFMLPFALEKKKGSNDAAKCLSNNEICQIKLWIWSLNVKSDFNGKDDFCVEIMTGN